MYKEEQKDINTDLLMLKSIRLENTGLFNFKGNQSTVFNRLKDNNITTLEDLFKTNQIQYGSKKMGDNYYIYEEIDGIIRLLKYKYLGIYPEELKELLNFKINTFKNITIVCCDYGYPGKIFNTAFRTSKNKNIIFQYVNEFYRVLKSCGFDQTCSKALIDIAYSNNINDVSLGEFICNLNPEEVKGIFSKVPQEYPIFINVLNIIVYFYNNEKNFDSESCKKNKNK